MTELKETPMATLCKKCNVSYPTTKEHFYSRHGKLQLYACKDCRKKQSRVSGKSRNKQNKKIYNKLYYQRRKAEKEKLKTT